jgi:1,6-anhydro-N-acetylmuramate kinase
MSVDIRELEKAWLEAETVADEAKRAARQYDDELKKRNSKAKDGGEVKILITSLEEAKARQEQAERSASDAFEKLWQAKSGSNGSATAYA